MKKIAIIPARGGSKRIPNKNIKVFFGKHDEIEKSNTCVLDKGDSFHVHRGLRHRMLALEDTELFEFSTQHFDSDSHRIEKGD